MFLTINKKSENEYESQDYYAHINSNKEKKYRICRRQVRIFKKVDKLRNPLEGSVGKALGAEARSNFSNFGNITEHREKSLNSEAMSNYPH